MVDETIARWAKVLVGYSVEVKRGDVVGIQGGVAAEPLLLAIAREVVRMGAHPVVVAAFPGQSAAIIGHGDDDQIAYVSPVERFLRTEADVLIRVEAETNTRSGAGLDPAKQSAYEIARADLRATFMRRAAEGSLRWTLTIYPTDAYAQDADMSTEAFADYLFAACKLHAPDPVGAWRQLRDEQQRLIDWLQGKSEVRVVGPETDLTLSIAGRTWINSDGHRNFPSGEIFTGPVETSANGTVRFSFPVVTKGREVDDVRLVFRDGKVVEASAGKEEAFLLASLDTDQGARFLGEFAFGTNFDIQRFSKQILLDEKIGGTVHVALGAGYPDTGSTNRSAIHWDMICDLRQGGEVTVDGAPFLRDGVFLV